jgi:hypothetical protein
MRTPQVSCPLSGDRAGHARVGDQPLGLEAQWQAKLVAMAPRPFTAHYRRLGLVNSDTCRNDSFLLKSRPCSNNRKKKGHPAAAFPVPNPDIKD